MMELPTESWIYQGTLGNGVMARQNHHLRRRQGQSWVGYPEVPWPPLSVFHQHLTIPPQLEASWWPTWEGWLPPTQSRTRDHEGGETSVGLVHNVNISNHIPWCSAVHPFNHLFIELLDNLHMYKIIRFCFMCKIICFSMKIHLELFRLFQTLFWVNVFLLSLIL